MILGFLKICAIRLLLLPMCHKLKKWSITGFPNSLHLLGHSSRIHFAIDVWRSEIKDLMIKPVPSKKAKAFWWPRNSILELLPASFAWWWEQREILLSVVTVFVLIVWFQKMSILALEEIENSWWLGGGGFRDQKNWIQMNWNFQEGGGSIGTTILCFSLCNFNYCITLSFIYIA